MRGLEPLVEQARQHYEFDRDLNKIVINSVSWVEANLAVELLSESVPSKTLVTTANVREAIKELPRCPMAIPMDLKGLAWAWGMERDGTSWARSFEDAHGEYQVLLLGEGNFLYDIVVRVGGKTIMWMPHDSNEEFLNPEIIDLIMERPAVLNTFIDLVQAMGLPFYPSFYMSLEDWRQEYAQAAFEEVMDVFGQSDGKPKPKRDEGPDHATKVRFRGTSDDAGVSWLL